MLPLFALLLFALVGIGALTIDVGLALTEQARLESSAEVVAWEWRHALDRPESALPAACAGTTAGSPARESCLARIFVAPLVRPLGLEPEVEAAAGWSTRARALDGTPLDASDVALGRLETGGVERAPTAAAPVRLARTTPLLFGWGALLPATRDEDRLDLPSLQAARREAGPTPELDGRGLRGRGFAPEASALVEATGVPAMRVGRVETSEAHRLAGIVGLAWRVDDLLDPASELVTGLAGAAGGLETHGAIATGGTDPGGEVTTGSTDAGGALELLAEPDADGGLRSVASGLRVACAFDPATSGRHLGEVLTPAAEPARPAMPGGVLPVAYVPVVPDCGGPVLGFLQLEVERTPTRVVLRPSLAAVRPNASAAPGSAVEARDAARAFADARRAALLASPAFARFGLRVPLPRAQGAS